VRLAGDPVLLLYAAALRALRRDPFNIVGADQGMRVVHQVRARGQLLHRGIGVSVCDRVLRGPVDLKPRRLGEGDRLHLKVPGRHGRAGPLSDDDVERLGHDQRLTGQVLGGRASLGEGWLQLGLQCGLRRGSVGKSEAKAAGGGGEEALGASADVVQSACPGIAGFVSRRWPDQYFDLMLFWVLQGDIDRRGVLALEACHGPALGPKEAGTPTATTPSMNTKHIISTILAAALSLTTVAWGAGTMSVEGETVTETRWRRRRGLRAGLRPAKGAGATRAVE